jgi:hypothetical protein
MFFENVPDPLWRKDVPYLIDQLDRAKLPRPPADSSENNRNVLETLLQYVASLEDSEFTGAARRHLQRAGFDCVRTALSLCESRTLSLHANTANVKAYVRGDAFTHSVLSESSKKRTNDIGTSTAKKRGRSPLSHLSPTQLTEYPSISLHFPSDDHDEDDDQFAEEKVLHDSKRDEEAADDENENREADDENALRNLVRAEAAAADAFEQSFGVPKKKPRVHADAVSNFQEKLSEELNAEAKLRALFS